MISLMSFDPGSTHCGWAMIDVCTKPNTNIVDQIVFIDGGEVASTAEAIHNLIVADFGFEGHIAIEWIQGYAFGAGKGAGVVKHLLSSAAIAGLIEGVSHSGSGNRTVHRMSALEWRRLVIGKPGASDAMIKTVVERSVRNLPKRTNAHVRDAIGVAMGVAYIEITRGRAS